MTSAFRRAALAAFALVVMPIVQAGTLATGALNVPLSPGAESSVDIAVPGLDASKPVWVAYHVVGLSADASPRGEVVMEASFEGVATSVSHLYARMEADAMNASSGSTIGAELEKIAGKRSPADLKAVFGDALYAAYAAVVSGTGATLDGRVVQTLPAPGRADAPLQVEVARAEGVQPVLVAITVGQGAIPGDVDVPVEQQTPFRIGRALGVLGFLALVGWFVLRRR